MTQITDLRVYFAAERTLLAWSRTGISMMGLGFVVAKFGLFLQILRQSGEATVHHTASLGIGMGLVILGTLTLIASGFLFLKFLQTFDQNELPYNYRPYLGLVTTFSLALIGFILAFYLFI